MIPIDVLLMFFGASVLLALAPGPDNIFVLTQSALREPLSGFVVTLGLCTGLLVHTLAVAFGVAAIFQGSAVAFALLKLIGDAALAIGVSCKSFSQLLNGHFAVSPEMAIRLSKALGTSPQMWLVLQMEYDLEQAQRRLADIQVQKLG